MSNFIADDKFDILGSKVSTLAANWSPINSPSFIFIGPNRNSTVVWAYLKLGCCGFIAFKNNNYYATTIRK